jgi:hypothetical protein
MPPNRLAREASAYLRQHQDNPVDWWPWGEAALALAQREDKPLFVSVGYSACHWCHVMAHESFEDPATAALLNQLFVNVKVDREERPDVDQIYMDTVTRLTGHGGWPLHVFCTPTGKPFYGGTYWPPEPRHGMPAFRQVVEAVARAWREQRAEVEQSALRIMTALREEPRGVASELPGAAGLRRAAEQLLAGADRERGGFGRAPKFPTPVNLELLLAACDVLPEAGARDALGHVVFTCREMARGGIYDQLAGGFHRYSVDAEWLVPHFEKMLYDQGQLLGTYAEAFRRSGDEELSWPIRETAAWLRRELCAPDGGWFASGDADSEGEEGRYFVWRPEEVEAVLGPERGAAFCAAYGVTREGSFEHGTSVLRDVARKPRAEFAAERAALLAAREKRVAPGIDRKRVAGWNALTVSGLARAASALGDPELLADATAGADFVLARMLGADGRLLRSYAEGAARVGAFLDDHAALLGACLDLHRAGAGARFVAAALGLAAQIAARFFEPADGDLFLVPSDGEPLPHRPRSDHDGATPHSTGLAVLGLVRAAALSGRSELRRVADAVLRTHAFAIERVPAAFPTLLRAAALAERGLSVAVVVGDPAAGATRALAAAARRALGPEDAVVVARPGEAVPDLDPTWLTGRGLVEGRSAVYLCRGTTCALPVTEPEVLAALVAGEAA